MRGTPPSGATLALTAAKSLVLAAALVLGFGLAQAPEPDDAPRAQPPATRVDLPAPEGVALARALERHDCSEAGFDPEVQPRSALIRRHGRLRHVSFEEGWAVFTERRTGVLLALCLDQVTTGPTRSSDVSRR